ncbi:MAG TPA: hypothetical protein QF887_00695, partial [SAR324 cluster bacterium]|nr:hypothetical protein [SAR324 cluster bacterium]
FFLFIDTIDLIHALNNLWHKKSGRKLIQYRFKFMYLSQHILIMDNQYPYGFLFQRSYNYSIQFDPI